MSNATQLPELAPKAPRSPKRTRPHGETSWLLASSHENASSSFNDPAFPRSPPKQSYSPRKQSPRKAGLVTKRAPKASEIAAPLPSVSDATESSDATPADEICDGCSTQGGDQQVQPRLREGEHAMEQDKASTSPSSSVGKRPPWNSDTGVYTNDSSPSAAAQRTADILRASGVFQAGRGGPRGGPQQMSSSSPNRRRLSIGSEATFEGLEVGSEQNSPSSSSC